MTGEVIINKEVKVDKAYELGKMQKKEFQVTWPDSFYKHLKRVAVPMTANQKSINVGREKIIDTGVLYARALGLREGSRSIESMLETELSPVTTSMFDDQGQMRTTQKAELKSELAVQRSHRGVTKDSYFLDGCAILWVKVWPCAKNAVVQDYIDAFREHVRRYQQEADVFFVFDRYVDGSTK